MTPRRLRPRRATALVALVAAAATATVVMLAASTASATSQPEVLDPVASQGEAVASVYFRLIGGSDDDTLVGVATDVAAATLHHTEVRDGITTMRRVDRIHVPANGTVTFAPGGAHVMLESLTEPLAVGDRIDVRFEFERSGQQVVSVPVVSDAEIARRATTLPFTATVPSGTSSGLDRPKLQVIGSLTAAVLVLVGGGWMRWSRRQRAA